MACLRIRPSQFRSAWLAAVVVLALQSNRVMATDTQCYYPDGTESIGDRPCVSTGTTHCCSDNALCMTSGYCMVVEGEPYTLSRGSCTDKNWGSGCPTHCISSLDDPSGGSAVTWLGLDSSGVNQYCCGAVSADNGSAVCPGSESSFAVGSLSVIFGAALLTNSTNTTSASSSTTSSLPTTTSGTGSSGDTGNGSSGGSSDGSNGSSASSNTVAVGAGVGASLGVALLVSIGWALWERRKRKQEVQALMSNIEKMGAMSGAGGMVASPPPSEVPGSYNESTKIYMGAKPPAELSAVPRYMEEMPAQDQQIQR